MASCPLSYRLGARALRAAQTVQCQTLYAVGGLYGNMHALSAIRERAAQELTPPTLIFNGDFNFFNCEPSWWHDLNRDIMRSPRHIATAGNVEVESSAIAPSGLGCGCGYPAYVSTGVVERSDRIVAALRDAAAAAAAPELLGWLRALPLALVAEVGGRRVGIVHGDVESLAGWGLGVEEAMSPPDEPLRAALGCGDPASQQYLPPTPRETALGWMEEAEVVGLVCTHTCLPHGQAYRDSRGGAAEWGRAVFNNGSAGMPNFEGQRFGLITRVSADLHAVPPDSLYGVAAGGLRFDALPVHYDHDGWMAQFEAVWPAGSDAHASYHARLVRGPGGFTRRHAAREGVS